MTFITTVIKNADGYIHLAGYQNILDSQMIDYYRDYYNV